MTGEQSAPPSLHQSTQAPYPRSAPSLQCGHVFSLLPQRKTMHYHRCNRAPRYPKLSLLVAFCFPFYLLGAVLVSLCWLSLLALSRKCSPDRSVGKRVRVPVRAPFAVNALPDSADHE